MSAEYNLCIIKPNKSAFSETFIQAHIDGLAGHKKVLYGGSFPVYDEQDKFLIKSIFGLLSYLIQKKLLKRKNIKVRTYALKKYLVSKKIDAVFAEYGTVGSSVSVACKLANVPLIIHFHGADVYHSETIKEYRVLYSNAFKYASAFIAVSADMAETLKEMGAPGDKVFTASCGVDTDSFPPINISSSKRDFIFVGRFVEKKSPTSLVKAFKIVVAKYPDSKLWMVGNGPLYEETTKMVNQLGLENNITLTGVLKPKGIKKLMHNMRGFLQHSVIAKSGDMEGTPVTILEASSSGMPVISTRHAGIKEAVIDGITGLLCDEYDVEEMAKNIIAIAESKELAAQLGKAGRRHMIDNYDINKRIALLNGIILDSIAQHNKLN